jgi:hypothetical protein
VAVKTKNDAVDEATGQARSILRLNLSAADIEALTALCRSCQAELRAAAKPRGERLLAEPTSNLEERVELYWTSAQGLAALAPTKVASAARQAPSHRVKSTRYRRR